MFASICCDTEMAVALPPWPTTSTDRSGVPDTTVATSPTRTVAPFLTTTGVLAMSAVEFSRPVPMTR